MWGQTMSIGRRIRKLEKWHKHETAVQTLLYNIAGGHHDYTDAGLEEAEALARAGKPPGEVALLEWDSEMFKDCSRP